MSHGATAKQRTRRTVRSSLSVGTRIKNSWVVVIRKASQLCQKDGREFLPLSFITSYKCILPTCHCRNCKCKRSGVATLRLGIKKLDLIANFLVLGMRSIATSVSVCLYVDCSRIYQKLHALTSWNFTWSCIGPSLTTTKCVLCASGLCITSFSTIGPMAMHRWWY